MHRGTLERMACHLARCRDGRKLSRLIKFGVWGVPVDRDFDSGETVIYTEEQVALSPRSGDREGPREHPPLVVARCGARSAAGQTGQVADKDVVALL